MNQQRIEIKLHSPAFLGDAEQKGVWRTPPIKALLREWWRLAVAREFRYEHRAIREQEGLLFGNAWLDGERFCQSKVRIALKDWHPVDMNSGS